MLVVTAAALQLVVAMPSDDARLLREVKEAQARYESIRRTHLPREWSPPAHSCDAHIGRFCYWYDSTETAPIPEPPAVAQARSRLLAFLDSSVAIHPTTAWLLGQRTRYLIEAKRLDDAIGAARSCRAEARWCAALGGLALHVATRFDEADSAFALALALSSPEQRCGWYDLKSVVPNSLVGAFRRASCGDRKQLAERLWALSKPLWMTDGNDLRTEHFARLMMTAVFARTANAYGLNWGDDSREMMVRYGWAEWFTRDESSEFMMAAGPPRITGHDREPSYSFFPSGVSATTLTRVDASSWKLREPIANSRYSPRHFERLSALAHQLARFPMGDSTLLVTALAAGDSAMRGDSLSGFLGVLNDTTVRGVTGGQALRLMVSRDTFVASIEALGARSKHAARARHRIEPLARNAGWTLSDLLLYEGTGPEPLRDLDAALARAITKPVDHASPIGVLWLLETTERAPIELSVSVTPVRVSIARRLAARLHLAPDIAPVRLRWTAQSSNEFQSVVLRLPVNARGHYRVVLAVTRSDGAVLSSEREQEIR